MSPLGQTSKTTEENKKPFGNGRGRAFRTFRTKAHGPPEGSHEKGGDDLTEVSITRRIKGIRSMKGARDLLSQKGRNGCEKGGQK